MEMGIIKAMWYREDLKRPPLLQICVVVVFFVSFLMSMWVWILSCIQCLPMIVCVYAFSCFFIFILCMCVWARTMKHISLNSCRLGLFGSLSLSLSPSVDLGLFLSSFALVSCDECVNETSRHKYACRPGFLGRFSFFFCFMTLWFWLFYHHTITYICNVGLSSFLSRPICASLSCPCWCP